AAIVITGEAEQPRERQDDQRRRKRQPSRPPRGLWSQPGVGRVTEQFRTVERREIRTEGVVRVLKCGPGRIDQERAQNDENDEGLDPPGVAPEGLAGPSPG